MILFPLQDDDRGDASRRGWQQGSLWELQGHGHPSQDLLQDLRKHQDIRTRIGNYKWALRRAQQYRAASDFIIEVLWTLKYWVKWKVCLTKWFEIRLQVRLKKEWKVCLTKWFEARLQVRPKKCDPIVGVESYHKCDKWQQFRAYPSVNTIAVVSKENREKQNLRWLVQATL